MHAHLTAFILRDILLRLDMILNTTSSVIESRNNNPIQGGY